MDWLSVAPAAGDSTGEADPITVSYNLTDLGFGQYTTEITVSSPEAGNRPQSLPVTVTIVASRADFDEDGDVDQVDFGHFQACMTGPGFVQNEPECANAQLDTDDDVDQADFNLFLACMAGPNRPAAANCAR